RELRSCASRRQRGSEGGVAGGMNPLLACCASRCRRDPRREQGEELFAEHAPERTTVIRLRDEQPVTRLRNDPTRQAAVAGPAQRTLHQLDRALRRQDAVVLSPEA